MSDFRQRQLNRVARPNRSFERMFSAVWVTAFAAVVLFWTAIVFVGVHFARKYW